MIAIAPLRVVPIQRRSSGSFSYSKRFPSLVPTPKPTTDYVNSDTVQAVSASMPPEVTMRRFFAPVSPSWFCSQAVKAMLKLPDVEKTDVVSDLGCGEGGIVITAAREYGARGVGIDINPERIAEAKDNAKKAGVENLVRFEENHLFVVTHL